MVSQPAHGAHGAPMDRARTARPFLPRQAAPHGRAPRTDGAEHSQRAESSSGSGSGVPSLCALLSALGRGGREAVRRSGGHLGATHMWASKRRILRSSTMNFLKSRLGGFAIRCSTFCRLSSGSPMPLCGGISIMGSGAGGSCTSIGVSSSPRSLKNHSCTARRFTSGASVSEGKTHRNATPLPIPPRLGGGIGSGASRRGREKLCTVAPW